MVTSMFHRQRMRRQSLDVLGRGVGADVIAVDEKSLHSALASAMRRSSVRIFLARDIGLNKPLKIDGSLSSSVTIDGGGRTLTMSDTDYPSVIDIVGTSALMTVTLTNIVVSASAITSLIKSTESGGGLQWLDISDSDITVSSTLTAAASGTFALRDMFRTKVVGGVTLNETGGRIVGCGITGALTVSGTRCSVSDTGVSGGTTVSGTQCSVAGGFSGSGLSVTGTDNSFLGIYSYGTSSSTISGDSNKLACCTFNTMAITLSGDRISFSGNVMESSTTAQDINVTGDYCSVVGTTMDGGDINCTGSTGVTVVGNTNTGTITPGTSTQQAANS